MLARLGLSDEEVEKMRVQLPQVLDYIAILQRVDTSAIPPTAQIISLQNVMRADESRPSWPVEDILSNAPAAEEGFFRVPAVLEEGRADIGGGEAEVGDGEGNDG
jgi:aspartyl-tRNA(Asn)/glutamyl-tRNA(Gln) amidotransferase subunit C